MAQLICKKCKKVFDDSIGDKCPQCDIKSPYIYDFQNSDDYLKNQVPVVNADRGFYTMITDSHGKILADYKSPEGSSKVVIADVTLGREGKSLYTRLGNDWLGYLSLAGFIFFWSGIYKRV